MPNKDTTEAWGRFRDDMRSLGDELRRHYRDSGDEKQSAEINRSLKELGEAADAFFSSLDTASRDPEVRATTRRAARSFGQALRDSLREVADELDKALHQPASNP